MGNKLSCSCGPLKIKGYRFESHNEPWSAVPNSRQFCDTKKLLSVPICRLWAEVFHVTTSNSGTVKWTQVSEDLVPVNITCIQDTPNVRNNQETPNFVFHVTAYNSQVEKILDVKISQPGTRIGQASECFVYWKDTLKNDTWGLNFTSPIDAKQFREYCDAVRFSGRFLHRSGGSSGGAKVQSRSTPASPTKKEPQCTCRTPEQFAKIRPNYDTKRAATPNQIQSYNGQMPSKRKQSQSTPSSPTRSRKAQCTCMVPDQLAYLQKSHVFADKVGIAAFSLQKDELLKNESIPTEQKRSSRQHYRCVENKNTGVNRKIRSKSTDQLFYPAEESNNFHCDSKSMKRMLKPFSYDKPDAPQTSTAPFRSQKRKVGKLGSLNTLPKEDSDRDTGFLSEPEASGKRQYGDKNCVDSDYAGGYHSRRKVNKNYLLDNYVNKSSSPLSDTCEMFDNSRCFATTPSSSNENSDVEVSTSPTSQLLLDYEEHLRNTLEKGLDAESYSLKTFEALLTQSMENLEQDLHNLGPGFNPKTNYIKRRGRRERLKILRPCGKGYYADIQTQNNKNNNKNGFPKQKRCTSALNDYLKYSSDGMPKVKSNSFQANRHGRQDSIRSGYHSDFENRSESFLRQMSNDTQDSRQCYLTSSEMSDDDRMSLTTAISDEEDADSTSSLNRKASKSAASFNCTGAVRKAGFLSVKKWILRKKHQIELARKRGWKGYWVCLKGTTLLFYPCDTEETRSVEATPKHLIIVDGAIMQAIPEHPKRDYVFCLSTAFGDAYLFQAPCQIELENWINSIHSACSAAFARHRGKTGTLHLLQEEIFRLEKNIESEQKLKHMAELQLSVVDDIASKEELRLQIKQWDENLERIGCEQFRLRCYMASLQNGELPNPKGMLTQVTQYTKSVLNQLGVFTVSSFHAYVSARSPSLLNNLLAGRGVTKRRSQAIPHHKKAGHGTAVKDNDMLSHEGESQNVVKVLLPENKKANSRVTETKTVDEFLMEVCHENDLAPAEHFIRVKKRKDMSTKKYFIPQRTDLIEAYLQTHEVIEVCAKILYQVELARNNLDCMWGFSVEAELVENSDMQDELCCYVSRVEERSVAIENGIIKGDEIMVINGAIVSDLDMMFIESVLQEEVSLCMMMRSARTEAPKVMKTQDSTDDIIESLVCPPPPSDNSINEDVIVSLIVPAPGWSKDGVSPNGDTAKVYQMYDKSKAKGQAQKNKTFPRQQKVWVKGKSSQSLEELAAFKSNSIPDEIDTRGDSPNESIESTESPSLLGHQTCNANDAEKLRKVITELLDTEQNYVDHLEFLMNTYLEPLRRESFLSNNDIESLAHNIQDIYHFQIQFLQTLEDAIDSNAQFGTWTSAAEFKEILCAIGNAFLYHVNHFKLYSSFCASHSKAQKTVHSNEDNQVLQEFLASCNPRQQQSTTFESCLIKPIQRILKYPLLLQQMKALTPEDTVEQQHLKEALAGMEKVAEHINEMQRIHEEYGAIFDHLLRQHQKASKQTLDLSPGDLLYYGGVEWLNISHFLGKIKKGIELHAMCFVFKTAVVFLCKERLRHKKRTIMGAPVKSQGTEVEIIRYQVLIPVTEVQVRTSNVKDVDTHFLWELIHLKNQLHHRNEKVYHLSNSTAEFRNAFLKTIRQIIRESVRNMSLPSIDTYRKSSLSTDSTRTSTTTSDMKDLATARNNNKPFEFEGLLKKHYESTMRDEDQIDFDVQSETDSAHDGEYSSGFRSEIEEETTKQLNSYTTAMNAAEAKKAADSAQVGIATTADSSVIPCSAEALKAHETSSTTCSDAGSPVWKPRGKEG